MTNTQLPKVEDLSMRPWDHKPLPFGLEGEPTTQTHPSEHPVTMRKRTEIVGKSSASRAGHDLTTFLRRFIASSLADGEPTIKGATAATDMTRRTLQRRLKDEGCSYRQLVEEVRLGTAIRLLVRPGMKLADIGRALGYSDPAHFTRAFRRWTGETPSTFRRRLRQGRRR